MRDDKDTSLNS